MSAILGYEVKFHIPSNDVDMTATTTVEVAIVQKDGNTIFNAVDLSAISHLTPPVSANFALDLQAPHPLHLFFRLSRQPFPAHLAEIIRQAYLDLDAFHLESSAYIDDQGVTQYTPCSGCPTCKQTLPDLQSLLGYLDDTLSS